jgi:hypothetical protein
MAFTGGSIERRRGLNPGVIVVIAGALTLAMMLALYAAKTPNVRTTDRLPTPASNPCPGLLELLKAIQFLEESEGLAPAGAISSYLSTQSPTSISQLDESLTKAQNGQCGKGVRADESLYKLTQIIISGGK